MDTYLKYIKLVFLAAIISISTNIQGQAISVGVQIEDLNIEEKETFTIAVLADTLLTGEEIYSFRFHITYNTSYFEFLGLNGTGPVLTEWGTPLINSSVSGNIIIAGAGANPLEGNGEMFYLEFRSLRSGGSNISFNQDQSYWNEGIPAISFANGYVYASARSLPNIYPDSQNMFVGDETTLSVSGGLAPYVYATTDPSVAQIINDNVIQAIAPGKVRAFVTDDNDEVNYSSGYFEVRAVRMTMANDIYVDPTETVLFPLYIEIAPGTTIYSGSIEISYPSGVSVTDDALQLVDYNISFESRIINNGLRISFASENGISGSGVLFYIPFVANTSGNHFVQYQSTLFNETLLSYNTNNYIHVNTLPILSLSPSSGSLYWGESISISVNNGTPPFVYSVTNSDVASIDQLGSLTGLKGGKTKVTVEDGLGATIISQDFTVYDHVVTINNADGTLDYNTIVPVSTSELTATRELYSFEASFSFQDNYLEFIGVEAGNPQMAVDAVLSGSTVQLAGATSSGISSGTVCNLLFRIKNTLPLYNSANVSFNWFKANESLLYSTLQNGAITRVEQTSYRPVADAGTNFAADENTIVQLDGSGSYDNDSDPITYLWTAPPGISLNDATLVNPEFTTPEVHVNTPFEFILVVNDGTSDSDPKSVIVTVLQINKPPVADAGDDSSYPEGFSVELDGTGSYDPDLQPVSFSWESIDGVILFNPTNVTPSFIGPQVNEDAEYRFRLTVSDGIVTSEADTVYITVQHVNKPPVAFAGGDQIVDEETVVQLEGSLSSDPDGDEITYQWFASPEVTLSSTTVADPTFTAPDVRLDSLLKFTLIVNDGHTDSSPDEVIIYLKNTDELSSDAVIENVLLNNMESFVIDDLTSVVTMFMPYGYDVRQLNPDFELSPWATISPSGGTIIDFSQPQMYTVTAENGTTTRDWTVQVNVPELVVSRTINSGWNWLSLSVRPEDVDITTLMSSLTYENLDYLKSPAFSATWYSGLGWYGDLEEFPQYLIVQHKKATSGNWQVSGSEINPTLETVNVVSGWNSLPYMLKTDADINSAFVNSSIPNGNPIIKGEEGSALYYPESGWAGDLQTLKVLYGYRMKSQYVGNLRYDPQAISSPMAVEVLKATQTDNSFKNEYEFSATIIAEIVDEYGNYLTHEGDNIKAYCNDQLCGNTEAFYVGALERYIFILTYYSNVINSEIEFEIVHDNLTYNIDYTVSFVPDDVIGEAYLPQELILPITTGDFSSENEISLEVSPNPADRYIEVICSVPISNIAIYNTAGTKIYQQEINSESYIVNTDLFFNGLYFMEVTVGERTVLRKFIIKGK